MNKKMNKFLSTILVIMLLLTSTVTNVFASEKSKDIKDKRISIFESNI